MEEGLGRDRPGTCARLWSACNDEVATHKITPSYLFQNLCYLLPRLSPSHQTVSSASTMSTSSDIVVVVDVMPVQVQGVDERLSHLPEELIILILEQVLVLSESVAKMRILGEACKLQWCPSYNRHFAYHCGRGHEEHPVAVLDSTCTHSKTCADGFLWGQYFLATTPLCMVTS